ncbi:hypothetical protein MtrunA17_Chr1g0203841 [Medicago truncatula]|uniref:Transmembrane protein n=1 Tax=Medicago truncatula TaxID=3880 RepID=A0A396K7X2_MEDTR|nr:hypothetical protein MtrunA17_Chr1g0203841 [Medicago truncatula]
MRLYLNRNCFSLKLSLILFIYLLLVMFDIFVQITSYSYVSAHLFRSLIYRATYQIF